MAIIATITKQPAEVVEIGVSFAGYLAAVGDTASVHSVVPADGLTVLSSALVDGVLTYRVATGLNGGKYLVTMTITTTTGLVKEDEIWVKVREYGIAATNLDLINTHADVVACAAYALQASDTVASLAASSGASLVGYLPSGVGAVARTVQDKSRESVSVKDFGAVGNWNNEAGTGADDYAAFQAAIDYAKSLGGAEVFIPPGNYKLTAPLRLGYSVTLRSVNNLEGGAANLYPKGSHFIVLDTPDIGGGYAPIFFNLYNLSVIGVQLTTDFLLHPGNSGAWAWSTCEGCYFVNFRNMEVTSTGVHFLNNNFQQFASIKMRGADYSFIGNYANHDASDTLHGSADSFISLYASSAIDFSHNYITSMKVGNAPAPMNVEGSSIVRLQDNAFDGGSTSCVFVKEGSYQVVISGNKLTTWDGGLGLFLSNVSDINIHNNMIYYLAANAPFIGYESLANRIKIRDNITNTLTDDTTHDISGNYATSDISISGFNLGIVHFPSSGSHVHSKYYERTLTNYGSVGLTYLYVHSSSFNPGRYFNARRLATSAQWIIYDDDTSTEIYNSSVNAFNSFRVACYIPGTLVVEQD